MEITTSMAKILRYSIKDNDHVRIADEINCIKEYLNIIQVRHFNRFSFFYELEEGIMDFIMPKMILQPIVENAVFHGLEQKEGTGGLWIRSRSTGNNTILFEVEDNGKGMSKEVLDKLRQNLNSQDSLAEMPVISEKKSIGLINIHRRIKLLFGEAFGLEINSSSSGGTRVGIELPFLHNNQNQSGKTKNITY
jgi:two-component system sensor histidine kinase YesM